MARKPPVWFRSEDQTYCTTFRGQQVKLGKNPAEAEKAFHALLANAPNAGATGFHPAFRKLADLYLDFTKETKSARTYLHQRYFRRLFCDHVKARRTAELKPGDVTKYPQDDREIL